MRLQPENLVLLVDHCKDFKSLSKGGLLAPVRVALSDFGLSLRVSEERAVTRCGTLAFMAPEVIACPPKHRPEDNKQDERIAYGPGADVWSVGVLAYELLTGTQPFTCATDVSADFPCLDRTWPAGLVAKAYWGMTMTLFQHSTDKILWRDGHRRTLCG